MKLMGSFSYKELESENKKLQITVALQNGYLGSPLAKGSWWGRKRTPTHVRAHATSSCPEETSKSSYSQKATQLPS